MRPTQIKWLEHSKLPHNPPKYIIYAYFCNFSFLENDTCSGYISPEYIMHGNFSMQSDVFSFGVIVLEVISGKKNKGFSDLQDCLNLLGHVIHLTT